MREGTEEGNKEGKRKERKKEWNGSMNEFYFKRHSKKMVLKFTNITIN